MQPYTPDSLPLASLDYRLLLPLVGQANAALPDTTDCCKAYPTQR